LKKTSYITLGSLGFTMSAAKVYQQNISSN